MARAPVRVAVGVTTALGLGLFLQWVLWIPTLQRIHPALLLLSAACSLLCFALGRRLVRWAFAPLAAQEAELRQLLAELASKSEVPPSPRPVGTALDPALRELLEFGQRLRTRLGERRELELQLEQARAYKQGFLQAVRHELRTPLNSILGFADVLLSDLEGPLTSGQRENLTVIRRTGKRLQELFDEVIELASVVSGQQELAREPVDAPALLEQVGEALEEERGDRPVHIRLQSADGVPQVAGDPQRLRQLLRGMASHALSVSTGELLVLSARTREDQILLSISDPARRLSEADVSRLFARESAVSRRKGLDESTRLRIAIWQELAALHGGKLSLHSDGAGTELTLALPVWRLS